MTVATTIKRRRHCARWILGAACYLCLPFTLVQSVAPTKRYMRSPRMMIVATASIVPQRQRLVLAGTEDQPNRSVCLCVFFVCLLLSVALIVRVRMVLKYICGGGGSKISK